jgi:hypothetical protein
MATRNDVVQVIENKSGAAVSFQWDGNYWELPAGKHVVSELWPGRAGMAEAAVQRLTSPELRNMIVVYDSPVTVTTTLATPPPKPAVTPPAPSVPGVVTPTGQIARTELHAPVTPPPTLDREKGVPVDNTPKVAPAPVVPPPDGWPVGPANPKAPDAPQAFPAKPPVKK